MFGKLNSNMIRQGFKQGKAFLGKAYHKTKSFLGDVDSGVRLAKDIFSILQPAAKSLLGNTNVGNVNKHVVKALSGYENMRSKVMETDENVNHHVSNIIGDLKKKNINIGL